MSRRVVMLGERLVGDGQPPLIIAEAGVNHDGAVDKALRLVDVAADAGADMVKFQVFRAMELTTASAATATYQREHGDGATLQRAMLARLELSDADLARIRAHCEQRRIGFLATPFGVADIERLVRLDVPAIKLASTDLDNRPLLETAMATGLPLIISTGAALPQEIERTVAWLRTWGVASQSVLLHCVSGYPAPVECANLRAIGSLRAQFGVLSGFSDHTPSTQIAGWAVAAGACVLEKHFTLDPRDPGPDHAMSLAPAALAAYVDTARRASVALGTGHLGMTDIEAEVRTIARKSIVAAVNIAAGTTITPDLITVKRPGGGITPAELDDVVGRVAAVDVAADTVLKWDHVR